MINKEEFILIAGKPAKMDIELIKGIIMGRSLPLMREEQYKDGRRAIELNNWASDTLRRSSSVLMGGFGTFFITHERKTDGIMWSTRTQTLEIDDAKIRLESLEECLARGIEWANEDPTKREFYMRRDLLHKDKLLQKTLKNFGIDISPWKVPELVGQKLEPSVVYEDGRKA